VQAYLENEGHKWIGCAQPLKPKLKRSRASVTEGVGEHKRWAKRLCESNRTKTMTSIEWMIDSGATDHLTSSNKQMSSYAPLHKPHSLNVATTKDEGLKTIVSRDGQP